MQTRLMLRLIPRREWPDHFARGLLGVFLLFMPVGFQMEMISASGASWSRGLTQAVLAATMATGWFTLGTFRMWWFMPLFGMLQLLMGGLVFNPIGRAGFYELGNLLTPRQNMVTLFILSIATLAGGFSLLMRSMIFSVRRTQVARAELDVARRVHESIVPPIDLTADGVRVLARSRTSSTMGGDLIDVVRREGEIDVFVADVSGHGVKAGIVMAMLKAAVRTRLGSGGALGEILSDVNRAMADLIDPTMFATLACVRVRPLSGGGADVEFALAGHLPILHVRAADGRVMDLANECLPLGIERGERYVAGRTKASRGDVLAMATDGLIEVQDARGREYGLSALRESVRELATRPLEAMHAGIVERVEAHGAQIDDQTLALIRFE